MRDVQGLHSNAACVCGGGVESVFLGTRVQDGLLTEDDNLEAQSEREACAKDGNPAVDIAW